MNRHKTTTHAPTHERYTGPSAGHTVKNKMNKDTGKNENMCASGKGEHADNSPLCVESSSVRPEAVDAKTGALPQRCGVLTYTAEEQDIMTANTAAEDSPYYGTCWQKNNTHASYCITPSFPLPYLAGPRRRCRLRGIHRSRPHALRRRSSSSAVGDDCCRLQRGDRPRRGLGGAIASFGVVRFVPSPFLLDFLGLGLFSGVRKGAGMGID